jgi:hypothetical protein
MKITVVNSQHFKAWSAFFGCLVANDGDIRFPSSLWGFENLSKANTGESDVVIPSFGACYGFVGQGEIVLQGENGFTHTIGAGGFFSTRNGLHAQLRPNSVMIVAQALGFVGMPSAGGPIESMGRLRYIDGCSDTLLIAPQLKGNPCFNHLHFPVGIDQTEHTHPSTRFGYVHGGMGRCVTPLGNTELVPGLIFWIPKEGLHKFVTFTDHMDVIAYHPDSDFGPTHDDHPMVNRTLVDGTKIDNTQGRHLSGEVMNTTFPIDPAFEYFHTDKELA